MRLMKHNRSGKIAVYDALLVKSGQWVEVVEEQKKEAPKEEPPQKGVRLRKIKATATLVTAEPEAEKAQ